MEMTCIVCPKGCQMSIERLDDGDIKVTGNTCPNGERYARNEILHPMRTVTSTVRVSGGVMPQVSCKTEKDIPKGKIFECMEVLASVDIEAPVSMHQILVEDICHTGVNVIATKEVEKLDNR